MDKELDPNRDVSVEQSYQTKGNPNRDIPVEPNYKVFISRTKEKFSQ
jgi:hypothetical protein